MDSTGQQSKNGAVGKVIRLMEALVRSERVMSVRDLAAVTGVPRSTAHRFLTALESYGWAVQDAESGAYRAGLRFFLLNHRPVLFEALVSCAREPMRRLVERTGKTAILSVIEGAGGLCVHTEEPEIAVKFVAREGMSVPLCAGATGLVLLAFCEASLRERILASPLKMPDGSAADAPRLRERVAEIRRLGYAHSREEWMASAEDLSVPLYDRRGHFVAQLGIAGVAGTFGNWEADLLPALKDAAAQIASLM
ncbi:MAG: IclR family transcriptional regulator [Pyramidobacter sp.]|nr:IclR family transcriptional regulator [Pyramidobacter porci]MCI6259628.1 IclR family transcriptional regulator [Pyramidobacter sp.]